MNSIRYTVHEMNNKEKQDFLTLGILESIDEQSDVTQRHLANRLGIALGLTNSYLKRCVRKGLLKIQHAPANRYLYYLTPTGFAEKSRLTAQYLSTSLRFYRRAAESCDSIYKECIKADLSQIVLYGITDLAEIATIRAQEYEIKIIGTYVPESKGRKFLGLPIWTSINQVPDYDAILFTELNEPVSAYQKLVAIVDKEKILVPTIIGLSLNSLNANF